MPIYEYQCAKCGKVFEKIQKFSDAPLTRHEECGGEVTRLLSAPAFQFKGSGWYVTDYAKSSTSSPHHERSKNGESHGHTGNETKPESSTESKPAESKPAPKKE